MLEDFDALIKVFETHY